MDGWVLRSLCFVYCSVPRESVVGSEVGSAEGRNGGVYAYFFVTYIMYCLTPELFWSQSVQYVRYINISMTGHLYLFLFPSLWSINLFFVWIFILHILICVCLWSRRCTISVTIFQISLLAEEYWAVEFSLHFSYRHPTLQLFDLFLFMCSLVIFDQCAL